MGILAIPNRMGRIIKGRGSTSRTFICRGNDGDVNDDGDGDGDKDDEEDKDNVEDAVPDGEVDVEGDVSKVVAVEFFNKARCSVIWKSRGDNSAAR